MVEHNKLPPPPPDAVETSRERCSPRSRCVRPDKVILSCVLNIVLALLFFRLWSRSWDPSQATYSPANSAIEYESKVFTSGIGEPRTPYDGYPTTEIDDAWDNAYQYGVRLHISEEEAKRLPNQTVEIPGMKGRYVTGLHVFHQLHCLNLLRKAMYPEVYHDMAPVRTDGTRNDDVTLHLAHCIEHLRQATMCAADTTTMYYVWDDIDHSARLSMEITHTCRNFDRVRSWAFSRYFEDFDRYSKAHN